MRRRAALLALLLGAASGLTARDGRLSVTVSDARDRTYLPAAFGAWRGAERDLRSLGLTVPDVRLEAASSAADFARRTGEPWFVAATTRGTVIHTQRLGALAAQGSLAVTLRHEAFHAAQPPALPRWLAEGLARVFSGEGGHDPLSPTGLEQVPEGELDRLLANRTGPGLPAAYREATRRARQLVGAQGWARVLGQRGPGFNTSPRR
ncbi:hypothetical protein E5F05_00215 (plasmid) [Deinococcus metallilatus]|uniref:DUF4157 domain-containing protein n=1 Tax=Deinococcus metallilatus TaxID=1211322 RepID=A0AAJ5FC00_9DEIO|nr:hypothetical protein [Deinococcus metallilatus]MBB5293321.1 hypothetical protein [Deinococcus metallilatus]QBY06428.1 hypothetical protein E5F05_00215 [Deinococcus metallilatus]RXJ18107.1 hypothetical protein ERJ73_01730 [Deinococcus metallilatus]TLK32043.1 hypothetical protein FCS05_00845 [Deinococcus metallilatus]GMA15456.1 hypothetical protein GCM10025871_17870 [Deinococcus metallilatus]